ncbi:hypothetical protein GUJ93_ZPchr0006g45852 [Zizania palustris]|uniref:Transcription repressor n=1 Tax=Zizania palustris TaxID=103762 RepID=A0A8J5SIQ3_ZIZPA|nr:hypothetical protein GUJ93_ZPchr0006g45852 [Zizania palustris]
MKATTRRGMAGGLPPKRKKKAASLAARGFMCGCGGAKSVSIVSRFSAAGNISAATTPLTTSSTTTATTTAATSVKTRMTAPGSVHEADASAEGTPSVDALLRQLRELERGVRALGVREDRVGRAPRHGRSASDWGAAAAAGRRGRLEEESEVVVTESDDPLGDFRRSMVHMIVENEIMGAAELRELLQRFLSLNSARHHNLILRAFVDVWEELFAGDQHHRRPRPRTAQQLANVLSTNSCTMHACTAPSR